MFRVSDQMLQQFPTMERQWRSVNNNGGEVVAPNCPRCASPNTKFCYYNNYSLSQPRYFCKGCRRYWTKGGSLRNVPVGGGCRKNRRAKSSSSSARVLKDFPSFENESSDGGSDSVAQSNGSDIDLAVVFANFVNDKSSSSEISNSLMTPDSVQNESSISMIEYCQKELTHDHVVIAGETESSILLDEFPQEEVEFLENDMNAFALQSLLNDEVVQDVLWTDSATTLPNFTWQLQEFDSFTAHHDDDDQLKTSANLITDNWSSFDLSGFEVYSRP